jgi:hypothetical protein
VTLREDAFHLVNAGTVGEPRDGSRQATYVVFDPVARSVEFRRLDYDYAAARRKAETEGWRRARPNVFWDRAMRRATRTRHRLFPRGLDDSSLEAILHRQRAASTHLRAD